MEQKNVAFLCLSTTILKYASSKLKCNATLPLLPLLELLFVSEAVLSCPFLSADDTDMSVDFICIS